MKFLANPIVNLKQGFSTAKKLQVQGFNSSQSLVFNPKKGHSGGSRQFWEKYGLWGPTYLEGVWEGFRRKWC